MVSLSEKYGWAFLLNIVFVSLCVAEVIEMIGCMRKYLDVLGHVDLGHWQLSCVHKKLKPKTD